jgi:uncharacterized membrane protein YkgB
MTSTLRASITGRILASADVWSRTGLVIARYGLVAILLLIGGLKFTHAEAMGIQPLIAHSPLLSSTYALVGVDAVSRFLGTSEIIIALLVASRSFFPLASALGSALAAATFLTTLSFLLSTPGVWDPAFPALSATGSFLIKDLVLLGASAFTAGEALRAARVAGAAA